MVSGQHTVAICQVCHPHPATVLNLHSGVRGEAPFLVFAALPVRAIWSIFIAHSITLALEPLSYLHGTKYYLFEQDRVVHQAHHQCTETKETHHLVLAKPPVTTERIVGAVVVGFAARHAKGEVRPLLYAHQVIQAPSNILAAAGV